MTGADLVALLAPRPGRGAFAVRLSLIAALTTIVVELYGLSAATTVYMVFFTNAADRAASVKLGLGVLVVVTLVLALALPVGAVSINWPFRRFVAMAVFSAGLMFLGSVSPLKPVAAVLAIIVGFYVDEIGTVQNGEMATRGLLYTWLIPAIPVGVGLVVNILLAPRPRRLLQRGLADRIHAAAEAVRHGGTARAEACARLLARGDGDLRGQIAGARFEGALRGRDERAMSSAVASTFAILSAAEVLARDEGGGDDRWTWRDRAADTLDAMEAALRSGGYPVEATLPAAPAADGAAGVLRQAVEGFAEGPLPGARARTPFLVADALSNPDHLAYALKTTGAAMTCYVIYQLLDWPGIHTCLITCYIVALTTVGETVEKLLLRIAGAAVGALCGLAALVWLVPHMTGIVPLAALILAFTLPCAWIAAGGPRIGYAGFQIVFAFYLNVLQKPAPAFDLALGRDRVIGILLGNVVMYLVFTRVRPVSLSGAVDAALGKAVATLADLPGAPGPAAPAQARNLLAKARQDLAVVRYEPEAVRPGPTWFASRRLAAERLDRLQSPMLTAAGTERGRQAAAELKEAGAALAADGRGTDPKEAFAVRLGNAELLLADAT